MRPSLPFLLAFVLATPLASQDHLGSPPEYRFTLVYSIGGTASGPANEMSQSMAEAGYDVTVPGKCILGGTVCVGPQSYPYTKAPAGAMQGFSARYALTRKFSLGGGFEGGQIGGASGHDSNGYITSSWEATNVWAAAYWTPSRGFRLGVGPSYHVLTEMGVDRPPQHRFGLTGEMGVQFPRRSTLFCDIATRYHIISTTAVEVGTPGSTAVMTTEPHWTHLNLLFGLGVRI